MTTFIPFAPSANSNFQFQPSLDGATYTCIVKWNLAGQRYYIECYTLNGDLVFNLPLIGSPDFYNMSLTAGYFKTSLVYRESSNQFEVSD